MGGSAFSDKQGAANQRTYHLDPSKMTNRNKINGLIATVIFLLGIVMMLWGKIFHTTSHLPPIFESIGGFLATSVLLGFLYKVLRSDTRGAILVGLLVVSHWILDLIVHRPDLPLYPGDAPMVGLGLWNSVPATLIVEGLFLIAGIYLYLRTTTHKNKKGLYGFWGLVGFLILITISNLVGPPPPSESAIAWVGHLQWLFVAWAYWVDHNRKNRRTQP